MKQYQFHEKELICNGFLVGKFSQVMYGLPQALILSNKCLIKHLSKSHYIPSNHTPGLLTHPTQPVTFVLTVNDFFIKYEGKEHSDHLVNAIQDLYTCTMDYNGTIYYSITFKWDYHNCTINLSIPGYITCNLKRFKHLLA